MNRIDCLGMFTDPFKVVFFMVFGFDLSQGANSVLLGIRPFSESVPKIPTHCNVEGPERWGQAARGWSAPTCFFLLHPTRSTPDDPKECGNSIMQQTTIKMHAINMFQSPCSVLLFDNMEMCGPLFVGCFFSQLLLPPIEAGTTLTAVFS
jgi:hypothetical protein